MSYGWFDKQKTAYEMRISDWSSDVCLSDLLFNKRKNFINGSRQVWQFGFGENFAGLFDADPFAAGWTGAALFSPTAYSPDFDSSVEVDYYRAVSGFRGDISSNWSWDLYGQYSRSDGDYSTRQTLADSVASQDFRFGSCVGTVTPIGGKQCVDVDWYSPRVMFGDFTDAERDFLFQWETGNTKFTQGYVEGILSGDTSGIGRASCRKRVCQDCEISGGAVKL